MEDLDPRQALELPGSSLNIYGHALAWPKTGSVLYPR